MFDLNNKNRVTIEFIANGVLVILPVRNITTDEYDKSLVLREAELESMFRSEVESDSEVRRLQGKEPQRIPDEKKYRKMTVSEISDKQMHQFSDLDSALLFIKNEFKD